MAVPEKAREVRGSAALPRRRNGDGAEVADVLLLHASTADELPEALGRPRPHMGIEQDLVGDARRLPLHRDQDGQSIVQSGPEGEVRRSSFEARQHLADDDETPAPPSRLQRCEVTSAGGENVEVLAPDHVMRGARHPAGWAPDAATSALTRAWTCVISRARSSQ